MTERCFIDVDKLLDELRKYRSEYWEGIMKCIDTSDFENYELYHKGDIVIQRVMDWVMQAPWEVHKTED